ncbi:MAG: bifunctional glutamate N-acetyltransferase/amino-acid acetyltransferase ArgJ [Chloroflexi bacterium]|nr:bifunctional glutamate N-acetyltransferase/amino-acid acetyltransferase ArgJ [Chloroflexota bacterium]
MNSKLETVSGGITAPPGFEAGAVSAGIKKKDGKLDLGILCSGSLCVAAAVFTRNRVKAAPVVLSQQRLKDGRARAVVVNSGCANACTGAEGLADAVEMAELAARHLGVPSEEVLVASTGVIGLRMPMDRIKDGMAHIAVSREGGHDLARAIMTTDTVPKEVAVRSQFFTLGGVAKGAGMIHPDMATLLCFLTTDAAVEDGFLKLALRQAVDNSFNMLSIDGDTSTNDMVLIMASGSAGGEPITENCEHAGAFQHALDGVCVHLARAIARDGEGATKLIEVKVNGGRSLEEARRVARTVVSSPLVKSAIHGNDPNWGRVIAAVGRSGVELEESRVDLSIGGIQVARGGRALPFDAGQAVRVLDRDEVSIVLDLNMGNAAATAWGCDLSEEYVTINSQYTT